MDGPEKSNAEESRAEKDHEDQKILRHSEFTKNNWIESDSPFLKETQG
jgi:hypothetical protein